MMNYDSLPDNLPEPENDGKANHLTGRALPAIALASTQGGTVALDKIQGSLVIYCYPMTGTPGLPLPDGWDQIPGARGCTPQACAYRDLYHELNKLNVTVFGLSSQSTEYQREMAERLHLPFAILSDVSFQLKSALDLPVFEAAGIQLYKRLTLTPYVRIDVASIESHQPYWGRSKDMQ